MFIRIEFAFSVLLFEVNFGNFINRSENFINRWNVLANRSENFRNRSNVLANRSTNVINRSNVLANRSRNFS